MGACLYGRNRGPHRQYRDDERRGLLRRKNAADLARYGARRHAGTRCARRSGHASGCDIIAWRDQLQDAGRLGHRLHSNIQYDRAACCSNAGRACGDGLVRARDRIPIRAPARRRYTRRTQHADRTGVLRAARRGASCGMHTRGIGGHPNVAGRILSSQSLEQDHDALRPGVQSPLPSRKPFAKFRVRGVIREQTGEFPISDRRLLKEIRNSPVCPRITPVLSPNFLIYRWTSADKGIRWQAKFSITYRKHWTPRWSHFWIWWDATEVLYTRSARILTARRS